eukprot:Nk52_evm60s78 gene=Nk52_evmTU60s78
MWRHAVSHCGVQGLGHAVVLRTVQRRPLWSLYGCVQGWSVGGEGMCKGARSFACGRGSAMKVPPGEWGSGWTRGQDGQVEEGKDEWMGAWQQTPPSVRSVAPSSVASAKSSDDATDAGKEGDCMKNEAVKMGNHKWTQPEGHNTGIRVMNSLTNELEWLILRDPSKITWYVCGPTVYDHAHLGHARSYVSFDIIRRILNSYFHYNVVQVMGITDIDEKIISRAREANVDINRITDVFRREFFYDMLELGVIMPTIVCSVSENIKEMVEMIESLVEKGYAYEKNGSVYFDTKRLGNRYGKLIPESVAKNAYKDNIEHLGDKKNGNDFALWRGGKKEESVFWDSPWGPGRPGWHLECSTMACLFFGEHLDLHTGGADLKFPHHENEIAQCEAHFGCNQWANYFVHTGQLYIEGKKMCKSMKNFTSVKEILGFHSSSSFRMFCLLHRYRHNIEYNEERMRQAVQIQNRFAEFFLNIHAYVRHTWTKKDHFRRKWGPEEHALNNVFLHTTMDIDKALRNDFDTPLVIRLLSSLTSKTRTYILNSTSSAPDEVHCYPVELLESISSYVAKMLIVFGFRLKSSDILAPHASEDESEEEPLHKDRHSVFQGGVETSIDATRDDNPVIDAWSEFRKNIRSLSLKHSLKDPLAMCDQVRTDALHNLGVKFEDQSGYSSWKFVDKNVKKKVEKG